MTWHFRQKAVDLECSMCSLAPIVRERTGKINSETKASIFPPRLTVIAGLKMRRRHRTAATAIMAISRLNGPIISKSPIVQRVVEEESCSVISLPSIFYYMLYHGAKQKT